MEGDIADKKKHLALALAAKLCLHQSQVFREVNSQGIRMKKTFFILFLNKPALGTPGHVCNTFRSNVGIITT